MFKVVQWSFYGASQTIDTFTSEEEASIKLNELELLGHDLYTSFSIEKE